MRFLPVLLVVLAAVVFVIPVAAQLPPRCNGTCEPDPVSPTYAQTIQARTMTYNARAEASPTVPKAAGALSETPVNAGSESYNYAVPILSLPGRNGLDLNITLFYNSRVWTIDKTNYTATFNADRDFPGYGFRLGFGYLENNPSTNTWLLTEPDGSKRNLYSPLVGTVYQSFDSSYIEYNSTTRTLRRKNGIQWQYEQVGTSTIYRPIRIQDTNGNYLTITYKSGTGFNNQAIDTIIDTLGRIVMFNYDPTTHLLTSVTGPALGGGTRTYATLTWQQQPLNYYFSLTVRDTVASGTQINVLTGCSYPNNTSYRFVYGDWGVVTRMERKSSSGVVQSYVSYNYPLATTALSDHPTFTTQTTFDGVNTANWSHTVTKVYGLVSSYSITDPAGTFTTTNLYTSWWQTGLASSVTIQNGPTTFRTITNAWTQDDATGQSVLNPRIASVTTTLNDANPSPQSTVGYDYTTYGNVREVREFDYGSVLKRKTQTDYLTGSAYVNAHILGLAQEVRVYDGGGALKARTVLAYDATAPRALTPTPVQWQDTGTTARGNVTSITRYDTPPSGGAQVRTFAYDTAGNLVQADVDCCQQEAWSFTSATQYAYPESVRRGAAPNQLTTQRAYDLGTGLPLSVTDENNKITRFGYDATYRLNSVTRPDQVVIRSDYDDAPARPTVTTTTPIDATRSLVQVTTGDGLGRTTKQETKDSAPTSTTYSIIEMQYDLLGRVSRVSNPYAPGQTPVWTETQYDGFGRVSKVIPPDGSPTSNNTTYSYVGNKAIVTDPAGKQRRTYTDALGRLTRVDEPGYADGTPGTGSVSINGGERCIPQPGPCEIWDTGTVWITVDTFTAAVAYGRTSTATSIAAALANAFNTNVNSPVTAGATGTTVTLTAREAGRHSNYSLAADSATDLPGDFGVASFLGTPSGSRLTGGEDGSGVDGSTPSINTPLATIYGYDALGNLTLVLQGVQERSFSYDGLGRLTSATTPEAGAASYTYTPFNQVWTRTDARGVMTSHTYDGLNRVKTVSYTVPAGVPATPTVTYNYDEGGVAANALGRLTSMTDGVGGETYQYDLLGRVTGMTKTISGTNYPLGYEYNWAHALTKVTYPSGRQVIQAYDPIGRLNQITSAGTNYLTVNQYNAAHAPTSFSYGNGVQGTMGYNARMQLQSLAYANGATQLFSLTYGYGAGNNGQVQSTTDNVEAGRTVSYTYDAWARLKTAQTAGSVTFPAWGLRWDYDRYGNRTAQVVTAGSGVPSNSLSFANPGGAQTNRPDNYTHDAAGNMTNDGLNALVYDGESRVVTNTQTGAVTNYTYDGNGLRMRKQVAGGATTVYIFSGSKVIAEYENSAPPASPAREYIYSGAGLLATLEGSTAKYHHGDHMSVRVNTGSSGTVVAQQEHYPFGESWYQDAGSTKWQFTSYERDAESGNDYAMARYHVNRLGRFNSPDRIGGPPADPQSLNRYSYVRNNPVSMTDPSGLYPRDQHLYITFLLAVLAGRSDAASIAQGAGVMDNFVHAATGLLGFGWIVNFNKHFGIPCTVQGPCSSGDTALGRDLHLVEDNGAGGPHQIVAGYGLSNRILSSLAHVGLSLAGRSPDTSAGRGSGFVGAWQVLRPNSPYPEAAEFIRQTVNANGLTIVGLQVLSAGGVSSLGDVSFAGAQLIASAIAGGILVNIYQLPGRDNFYSDPIVRDIQRAFLFPGASMMAEAEALYLYQVYGPGGGGGGPCQSYFFPWFGPPCTN